MFSGRVQTLHEQVVWTQIIAHLIMITGVEDVFDFWAINLPELRVNHLFMKPKPTKATLIDLVLGGAPCR